MIFKHRQRVTRKDEEKLSKQMDKGVEDDFYLTLGITEQQIKQMDALDYLTNEHKGKIAGVIEDSADMFGRETESITLLPAQIKPVLLTYINPRYFIGDEPGLGKTVMSAASYAFYRMKEKSKGNKVSKVLVVTDAPHVVSFAKEWTSYGINMVAWSGKQAKINESIEQFGEDLDGVVCGWDTLKTNSFLEYYVKNCEDYQYSVWDETSRLIGEGTLTSKITNAILNDYMGGIERAIFLNGSSFEKNVYDYFYQFKILRPKLIPSKAWLDRRYVVKRFDSVYRKNAQGKVINQKYGEIVDFRNQEELKDRLRYYYIARSKSDFTTDGELPEHEYTLYPVTMTKQQEELLKEVKDVSVINSPTTMHEDIPTDRHTCPKIGLVVDKAIECKEDRPIIYVYNINSQDAIINELESKGVRVARLNGSLSSSEKDEVVKSFNKKELDMLVINVRKAINLPTSDRMIFYDIPTMPQTTGQIKARIDRNNYTKVKKYDFYCYLHSPEMVNLVRLGHFRERQASLFTGQKKNVYGKLVKQLEEILTEDENRVIKEKQKYLEEHKDKTFDDVKKDIEDLLTI